MPEHERTSRLIPDSWNLEAPPRHLSQGLLLAGASVLAAGWALLGGELAPASFPLFACGALWLGRNRPEPSTAARVEHLLAILEARDRYTASHCSRVGAFADLLAHELGIESPARLRDLRIAAILHDVGKLDVALDVLHKPAPLDPDEREAIERHVQTGSRRASCFESRICAIIEQHHERVDGRGYPRGLSGEQILLEARIVAVADAFDAMTSDRPYRSALTPEAALAELERASTEELQFDPVVVAALRRRFDEFAALCTRAEARLSSPLA